MSRPSILSALRNPLRAMADQRGSITVTFALLMIPMILVIGFAIDYTRMVQFRAALQNAVDEAAVAGASAFSDASAAATAQSTATNFYNKAILPPNVTRNAPTVTTNANGTINPAVGSASAYSVTVTASAKVAFTLFSLAYTGPLTISATGTAGSPVIASALTFTNVNANACDGNTAYLYAVPTSSSGAGYDYTSVPSFTTGTNGNYYYIGSGAHGSSAPSGNTMPSINANAPLGIAMVNQTGVNSTYGCGIQVPGANSYGAPYSAQNRFYSSLMGAGLSPSEDSNYQYQITVTTNNKTGAITGNVTGYQYLDGSWQALNGGSALPTPAVSTYNNLWNYLGINNPSSGVSNCTSQVISSNSTTTTTTYTCTTQYFTSKTSTTPNCSLYLQTGLTNAQVAALSSSSSSPSAAHGNCFNASGANSSYGSLSCATLSAMKNGTSSSSNAGAVVFWWDDGGGVGQNEEYYGPSAHCSASSSGKAGYGEDCQYQNNFFAMQCKVTGGGPSGYTEVLLTQ